MLPSVEELDVALVAKGGLLQFFKLAWAHGGIETAPLSVNWHHGILARAFEALLRGEKAAEKVCVNIPPGSTKSLFISVFAPAFAWGPGKRPDLRLGYGSFDKQLSLRDSNKCKDLIRSDWYQRRWGFKADPRILRKYGITPVTAGKEESALSDSASIWYTSGGGLRFATSTGSNATGWHFHAFFVDDPTKPKTIENGGDQARDSLAKSRDWWEGTIASRRVNPSYFGRWVVMQRLHIDDLAGLCLKEGYTPVVIPAEHEVDRPCRTPWGNDPRTLPGESFWPERFGPEALADLKASLRRHATAQLQQFPIPDGGMIFKPDWFTQFYTVLPTNLDRWAQSWDMSFSGKEKSDYVVGQAWASRGSSFYLCPVMVRDRLGLPGTIRGMEMLSGKYPKAYRKLVENKANGPAVAQSLEGKMAGIVLVEPEGGKVSRAHEASVFFEAGNVWLPDPSIAPWIHEYIQEFLAFPMGSHDDQVDATSQMLNNWNLAAVEKYSRLAAALRGDAG